MVKIYCVLKCFLALTPYRARLFWNYSRSFVALLSTASAEEMPFGSDIHCIPSQSTSSIFSTWRVFWGADPLLLLFITQGTALYSPTANPHQTVNMTWHNMGHWKYHGSLQNCNNDLLFIGASIWEHGNSEQMEKYFSAFPSWYLLVDFINTWNAYCLAQLLKSCFPLPCL